MAQPLQFKGFFSFFFSPSEKKFTFGEERGGQGREGRKGGEGAGSHLRGLQRLWERQGVLAGSGYWPGGRGSPGLWVHSPLRPTGSPPHPTMDVCGGRGQECIYSVLRAARSLPQEAWRGSGATSRSPPARPSGPSSGGSAHLGFYVPFACRDTPWPWHRGSGAGGRGPVEPTWLTREPQPQRPCKLSCLFAPQALLFSDVLWPLALPAALGFVTS